eukprot:1156430-Pelagomonas_calceolata.AAC.1
MENLSSQEKGHEQQPLTPLATKAVPHTLRAHDNREVGLSSRKLAFNQQASALLPEPTLNAHAARYAIREGKGYIAVPACGGSLAEANRACNL